MINYRSTYENYYIHTVQQMWLAINMTTP